MTLACPELRRFWGLHGAARIRVEAGERSPGRVVLLQLGSALRPPWLAEEAGVPVWLEQVVADGDPGTALAHFVDRGRTIPAVVETASGVRFRFDPDQMIAAIAGERYFQPSRPLHTRVALPYQLVPGPLRLLAFRWLKRSARRVPGIAFPQWPVDRSVETLRWAFRSAWMLAGGAETAKPRWPEAKRYAFCVSHDVDTARGFDLIPETARFENSLGVRSCWFVVGDLFPRDPALLDALRADGHEIGLHGDRHDNRIAYASRAVAARRIDRCQALLERHAIRGWRSPSLLESPTLRAVLAPRFRYTSDVPDSEIDSLIAPRRGCATSFPFLKDGLLEVPLTAPLEDKLLMAGMDEARILDLWREKLAWAKMVGGVAQLAIHNEPHLLGRCRGAYQQLSREARADTSAWHATPGEIADWWLNNHAPTS